VIVFIVSGSSRAHNFSMGHDAKDELLPWVAGGVLLIAATIAVAAIAGAGDDQAVPTAVQRSDSRAKDLSSDPPRVAAQPLPQQ
jgi:hypothetical protein